MHRNAIACSICGKMFFPASLKFHEKACIKAAAFIEIPCSHCDQPFLRRDLNAHQRKCKSRPRREKQPQKQSPKQHYDEDDGYDSGVYGGGGGGGGGYDFDTSAQKDSGS